MALLLKIAVKSLRLQVTSTMARTSIQINHDYDMFFISEKKLNALAFEMAVRLITCCVSSTNINVAYSLLRNLFKQYISNELVAHLISVTNLDHLIIKRGSSCVKDSVWV